MKVKDITIEIKDTSEVLKDAADVWKSAMKGKKIKARISISFSDIHTMTRFLTKKRLQLLSLIKRENPASIYALAKLADRNFKNVYEDLQILKDIGLVELSRPEKNNKSLKPVLLCSGLNLHFAF